MEEENKIPGHDEGGTRHTVVATGNLARCVLQESLIEIVRNRENANRLELLSFANGSVVRSTEIIRGETRFVAPDAKTHVSVTLPDGVRVSRRPSALLFAVLEVISRFIDIPGDSGLLVASFVLSTWFPECFEAVPYLWVVGPLASAKTTLLRVLSALCRRSLLVGDVRAGSLYKLTDALNPTLLIDELELDGSRNSSEVRRLLRTGTTPGIPAVRNGQLFSCFGFKVISSRALPSDAALRSRSLLVPLLHTNRNMPRFTEDDLQAVKQEFQPELLMFRFTNYTRVRSVQAVRNGARVDQIGHVLCAPLQDDTAVTSNIVSILAKVDDSEKSDRFLEPEWLVAVELFELIHPMDGNEVAEIFVGGIAAGIRSRLDMVGEDLKLGTRQVGAVLKSLGFRTERLGRMGRGLRLNSSVKEHVHEVARRLGIDRRAIATLAGLEAHYGGLPCTLCDVHGLAEGLKFVDPKGRSSAAPSVGPGRR